MNEIDIFQISEKEDDTRIDRILAARYQDLRSRSYFQFLISQNLVKVNGEDVKKHYRPKLGDEIRVAFVLTPELDLTPEKIPLNVLYEDEFIIAVNKPAGMVVHPAPGNWSGTFVNALLYHCKEIENQFHQQSARPGIVHRLDKETSGVLIAAKDLATQAKLTELFSSRQVKKTYVAVCAGNPGCGELKASIGRHKQHRKQMCVREDGREAITHYKTVTTDGKLSVVKIDLITGRTHQIRVHMQHLHTPVLGDATYGNKQLNSRHLVTRQLLHSYKMSLLHPMTKKPLELIADFPEDIKRLFRKLNYTELS